MYTPPTLTRTPPTGGVEGLALGDSLGLTLEDGLSDGEIEELGESDGDSETPYRIFQ